jgi:hypothetical protein
MRFPTIEARDLEGDVYTLPDGLPAGRRLVLVAFRRWQQILIDGWKSRLSSLQRENPDLTVWEVPALGRRYRAARPYIDGGMRAGIIDVDVRLHTLTSYTDLRALLGGLDIRDTETVHAFLVGDDGEILWRGEGEADGDKIQSLDAALRSSIPSA